MRWNHNKMGKFGFQQQKIMKSRSKPSTCLAKTGVSVMKGDFTKFCSKESSWLYPSLIVVPRRQDRQVVWRSFSQPRYPETKDWVQKKCPKNSQGNKINIDKHHLPHPFLWKFSLFLLVNSLHLKNLGPQKRHHNDGFAAARYLLGKTGAGWGASWKLSIFILMPKKPHPTGHALRISMVKQIADISKAGNIVGMG